MNTETYFSRMEQWNTVLAKYSVAFSVPGQNLLGPSCFFLGKFYIFWSFRVSLIPSTEALWSDSKLNSSYFFREIHHAIFRIQEELMMQKKSCKTSFYKKSFFRRLPSYWPPCTICSELELHDLFIFQIPPLT